jgi:hypothetical protein
MRFPAGALVLATLLGLVGAGCAGASETAACDLITDADAQRILGEATRAGVADDEHSGPGSSCDWISKSSTRDPHAAVYGLHISEAADSASRRDFEKTRDADTSTYDIEPVGGLGDEAYFVEYTEPTDNGTPPLPQLHIRRGDTILVVGTYDSDEHPVRGSKARTIELAAAELAVATLTD